MKDLPGYPESLDLDTSLRDLQALHRALTERAESEKLAERSRSADPAPPQQGSSVPRRDLADLH